MTEPLLDVNELRVVFRGRRAPAVTALDGVSVRVGRGETVGVVGESGSGKSTLGRAVLGLTPATSGTIRFGGTDVTRLRGRRRRNLARDLQAVFQDPYSSLNPTQTVGQILAEPLQAHGTRGRIELAERIAGMLGRIGLPEQTAARYPRELSGGQRQRIAIGRALMVNPTLLICDEALSALDISLQAQIANLLMDLQRGLGLGYLFIAHDLSIVRLMAQRTLVMRAGRIVEEGETEQVYAHPQHPYTRALLEAEPSPDPVEQRRRRQARRPAAEGAAAGGAR